MESRRTAQLGFPFFVGWIVSVTVGLPEIAAVEAGERPTWPRGLDRVSPRAESRRLALAEPERVASLRHHRRDRRRRRGRPGDRPLGDVRLTGAGVRAGGLVGASFGEWEDEARPDGLARHMRVAVAVDERVAARGRSDRDAVG
jgi:hypothetical protein